MFFAFVALLAFQAPETLVIEHVSVVPMDREIVLADHTVVIRDGRIAALGPSAEVECPAGARRIDGRGRFLMPGLADMHVHVPRVAWVTRASGARSRSGCARTCCCSRRIRWRTSRTRRGAWA